MLYQRVDGEMCVIDQRLIINVSQAVKNFVSWLDRYGEISYDHGSYYAGRFGCWAKGLYYRKPLLGTLAVSPMVISEALFPSLRSLFWKRQRFPIADAHYAMGFAFLAEDAHDEQHYQRALHFLDVLIQTRSPGHEEYCWGYPFNWKTREGLIAETTPLITTVPYAYEAFSSVFAIDKDEKWRTIMRSIAEHVAYAYRDVVMSPQASACGYTTAADDRGGVLNASAYRAALLTMAGSEFGEAAYGKIAQNNLNFVLEFQNPDGSWFYSADDNGHFIDHYHTCFVLKALAKIENITGDSRCAEAIRRGVAYYVRHLFDEQGLPKPFSEEPRLTIYRRGLYDYAEFVNLAVMLRRRFSELDRLLPVVLEDLLARWQASDGHFRSRELMFGWDNVPMHRYAQAQMFRSLCVLLRQSHAEQIPNEVSRETAV